MATEESVTPRGQRAAAGPADAGAADGEPAHVRYARLLGQIDLFSGIDRVPLSKLAARLEPVSYCDGAVIINQGDPGDAFYLIAAGTVGVFVPHPQSGVESRMRTLGPGEPVGEMALLTNAPRTATIRADGKAELLRLDRAAFLKLVREEPSVALAIAATLSRRLATMLNQSPEEETPPAAAKPAPADSVPAGAANGGQQSASVAWWRRWRLDGRTVGIGLAVLLLVVGLAMPAPAGLTTEGWYALLLLVALLPLLITNALPEGTVALALVSAWVVLGVASPGLALSGYASDSWLLVVGVLIAGAGVTSTGLLYRLSLLTISYVHGGFGQQVVALMLSGVVMGPAVPVATARTVIVAPMVKEVVEALSYPPRSPPAVGLSMAALVGYGQISAAFLTSSATAVLVFGLLADMGYDDLNWLTWTVYGAAMNVVLIAGMTVFIIYYYRPRGRGNHGRQLPPRSLALQQALLGAPSRHELIALAVMIMLVLGFLLQPLHGLRPAWVAALAVVALAAARVVTADTLRSVNWSFALLFGAMVSLSRVLAESDVDQWLADGAVLVLGGLSATAGAFLAAVAVLCFAVSLVIRWQASAPLITIALAPVAVSAGMHPFVIGLIAVIACNGFFIPYQSTTYMALHGSTGGQLFSHAQAQPVAMAYFGFTLLAVAASVPVWRLMGLI